MELARQKINSVRLANSTQMKVLTLASDDELTPAQVAREFKVSPATVRRWHARGWLEPTRRLPGSRYRRYSRADLDKFRKRLDAGEFDQPPQGNQPPEQ